MKMEPVKIKGNEYNLSGTIIKPEGSGNFPAVVFYHGMISQSKPRYIKRAEKLAENGIASLCFDFRGCGESDGKLGELSLNDWLSDGFVAFDFLASQDFVDPNRVGICGKSFGGYVGSLVSEKRNVKSMVLQAPAVYADEWADKKFTWDEEFSKKRKAYRNSENALDNNNIRAIEKFRNPILIIGSELDDTCPRKIVESYFEHAESEIKKLVWIKGADHALKNENHNQEFIKLIVDWFKKTL